MSEAPQPVKVSQVTAPLVRSQKPSRGLGTPLVMVTAYDYPTAALADRAGMDIILVGDSLAQVVQGRSSTVPVTMEEMLYHTRLVARGVERALVVGDMPFMSYQAEPADGVRNAGRFLKEAGATAVKIEGGQAMAPIARAIVNAGIPVMGHIGLTPQSVASLGGYKVQGRDAEGAKELLAAARALEEAGIFSLVLECIPDRVAERITQAISIPTIGIGAGPRCDGQVLVFHDLVGLSPGPQKQPRFVKPYADVGRTILEALRQFGREVREGDFPDKRHTYGIDDAQFAALDAPEPEVREAGRP